MSPALRDRTLAKLRAKDEAPPPLTPHLSEAIDEALSFAGRGKLPIDALRRLRAQGSAHSGPIQQQPDPKPDDTTELKGNVSSDVVEELTSMDDFFDPRHPPAGDGEEPRTPLASLKVGEEYDGPVVGASLYDGVKVDIGAEVDALVSMDLTIDAVAGFVAEECPLEKVVRVRIDEVYTGPKASLRVFPLIATLVQPRWPGSPADLGEGGRFALRLGPDDDPAELREVRGPGFLDPEAEALGGAAAEGEREEELDLSDVPEDVRQLFREALKLPRRPASEAYEPFPGEATAPAPGVDQPELPEDPPEALKAWQELTTLELERIHLEMRCRDRVARELDEVEADLSAGCPPSIPASLLGLTLLPCGRRCLLPVPEEGRLIFRIQEFDSTEQLNDWMRERELQHAELWAGGPPEEAPEEAREHFRRFFECLDVAHAKATLCLEEADLGRKEYREILDQTYEISDECMEELREEIESGIRATPALQDQEELAERGGFKGFQSGSWGEY